MDESYGRSRSGGFGPRLCLPAIRTYARPARTFRTRDLRTDLEKVGEDDSSALADGSRSVVELVISLPNVVGLSPLGFLPIDLAPEHPEHPFRSFDLIEALAVVPGAPLIGQLAQRVRMDRDFVLPVVRLEVP